MLDQLPRSAAYNLPCSAGALIRTILHFLNSSAGRTLVSTLLLWSIAFVTCKHLLWRDPHAAFFTEDGVYDLGYSAVRRNEARDFINHAESSAPLSVQKPTASLAPVICAAVTTFRRKDRQYFNETIGTMLVGLTDEERSILDVRALFAHTNASIHPDWEKRWTAILDHGEGYNVTHAELENLRIWESEPNFYAKGVFDYIYVFRDCLTRTSAPFIAVFEDDIVFAEGWLPKTLNALSELREQSQSWLYLRLFYTETALGWEASEDYWFGHQRLTFGLAIAVSLSILLAVRRFVRPSRRFLDNLTIAAIVLITIPVFTALAFMVGKYNLTPLHGLERMDRHGCCTQALIFPRSQAHGLIDWLKERGSGQTDALIEDYADEKALQRYALAPQVVQHVGIVSSRGNLEINTKSTWAFWFEAQNAEKLKTEHRKLARAGIWRATGDML